ncbi:MAG: O-methyltransferase [candidate division Zixibacteria bacterium]
MNITEPAINEYIKKILPRNDDVLVEMEDYASQNDFPIIGPMVGPFLRQMALITGAESIFEMGSGFGYSAYWFAGGMNGRGKIICTDGSDDNKRKALGFLKRGGFDRLVDFHIGNALEIIRRFDGPFDIILNDIDKEGYPEAFDMAIPRLKRGGLFITDNVLWSGRVLDEKPDKTTKAILEFNRKLFNTDGLLSSIIPIRDGLGIAVKL